MRTYSVKFNVIEIGRTVTIEANSKREARDKVRSGDWPKEGTGDPEGYKTIVVGKVTLVTQ